MATSTTNNSSSNNNVSIPNMQIAIIGTGLIGGSLAYQFKKHNLASQIYGFDNNKKHLNKALALGIIDHIGTPANLKKVDLIILSIPVNGVIKNLPTILDNIQKHQIVIDVSSTKTLISQSIDKHPNRQYFVSTHPMWGTEYSGPQAAQKNAFTNRVCVICDKLKSHPQKLKKIIHLFRQFSMNITYMNSIEHDVHTAYISHISHITSFALANTVLEKEKDKKKIFQLAGSGFESTVRLAKSAPETWVPIFEQNKKNVLSVLKEHIHQLQTFQQLLLKEDYNSLKKFITHANQIKKILH